MTTPLHISLEHVNRWFPDEVREQMRAVRLIHWQLVLDNQRLAQDRQGMGHPALAKAHDDLANEHMKAVQALDVFFEDAGDTAERDMDNALKERESNVHVT